MEGLLTDTLLTDTNTQGLLTDTLLTDTDVCNLVIAHDIFSTDDRVSIKRLDGGISCCVFRVESNGKAVIVKQTLPQLQTQHTWLSDVNRYRVEIAAASVLAELLPGSAPSVIAVEGDRHAFIMEAIDNTGTWKNELLSGRVDISLAKQAGLMLGHIHELSKTKMSSKSRDKFRSKKFFEELRLDAYFRTIAKRHTDLASQIEKLIDNLTQANLCLVHSDFSPKNLLVTPNRRLMLIDHEVAHIGEPAFDVAFCMALLSAKAIHMPKLRNELCSAMGAFVTYYGNVSSFTTRVLERVPQLLGAMMLARVDGKSPAEYLTESERERMRNLSRRLVADPVSDLTEHISLL